MSGRRSDVPPAERLRALAMAAMLTLSVLGVTVAFSAPVAAGNQSPTVTVDEPSDNANLSDPPTITGTASDDGTVDKVELRIQRANGDYFDGTNGGWQNSEVWFTVNDTSAGSVDWSYDTYNLSKSASKRISDDGVYNVTARVTDNDGNTVVGEQPDPRNPSDADVGAINYTVDNLDPQITSVTVTEDGGDDTVSEGDTVKVSVDATDATSGVDTVTVDASKLGGSSSLTLTESGGSYTATFTISGPSVGDGTVSLQATATDSLDHSDTASDSIELSTSVDSVDSLTIGSDFIGIVEDDNTSIRVTASGIEDARGNVISDGTATIEIAGTSYTGVTVSDGSIDTTIDPTSISDGTATGTATVELAGAGSGSATDSVVLVHEAIGLSEGYNLIGTPMSASDVRFYNVSDVTTYDPTVTGGNSEWVSPNEQQAGEGYYAFAEADDARVGYVFEQSGDASPDARYLHKGYNLVSASPELSESTSLTISNDLGAGVDTSSSEIQASIYTGADLSDEATSGNNAFKDKSGSYQISAFEGYFVHVENSKRVRTVRNVTTGYSPSAR